MGTINYKTSDYLTIGLKPYAYSDFENDTEFLTEYNEEIEEYGLDTTIYNLISDYEEEDYNNIEQLLNNYSFYYYHVKIEPGYYQGFSLIIENNFSVVYDYYTDRKAAQKELTELKKFLLECAACGLVVCFPGWCTGYQNYNQTVNTIKQKIKEMKEETRTIPTWLQYEKNSK